jgi:glutamate transport system substrate-binding protein
MLLTACFRAPLPDPVCAPAPLSQRAHLTIAIKTDEPGIGFMLPADPDEPSGLDIDIAIHVAKGLAGPNVRISWMPISSKKREKMIIDGDVDLVVASYGIVDGRLEQVDFAGPYLIGNQDVLVRTGDRHLTSVDDLRGRTVCTVENSTSKSRLERLNNDNQRPRIEILALPTYRQCVDKLVRHEGEVDGVSTDNLILTGYLGLSEFAGQLRLLGKSFKDNDYYGIGLARGRSQDCKRINELLQQMIKDGTWEKLVRKNLRVNPDLALNNRPVPGRTVHTCIGP